jgi:ketosteroid isomerase-like protein
MAGVSQAEVIRNAIDDINTGHPERFMDVVDEDAVFHIAGNSPIAGTYGGKAQVGQFLGHLAQLSEKPLHVDLLHMLTGGEDLVVAIWRAHASRKGWDYAGIAGYIFRLRAGKIVEATNLQEDQEEIDRFWSA